MSHLILDLIDCKSTLLDKSDAILYLMDCICTRYNLNVLQKIHHEFEPHGISIIYLLQESHFSMHTYPEKHSVTVDLYSCKEMTRDMTTIALELKCRFRGSFKTKLIIDRMEIL